MALQSGNAFAQMKEKGKVATSISHPVLHEVTAGTSTSITGAPASSSSSSVLQTSMGGSGGGGSRPQGQASHLSTSTLTPVSATPSDQQQRPSASTMRSGSDGSHQRQRQQDHEHEHERERDQAATPESSSTPKKKKKKKPNPLQKLKKKFSSKDIAKLNREGAAELAGQEQERDRPATATATAAAAAADARMSVSNSSLRTSEMASDRVMLYTPQPSRPGASSAPSMQTAFDVSASVPFSSNVSVQTARQGSVVPLSSDIVSEARSQPQSGKTGSAAFSDQHTMRNSLPAVQHHSLVPHVSSGPGAAPFFGPSTYMPHSFSPSTVEVCWPNEYVPRQQPFPPPSQYRPPSGPPHGSHVPPLPGVTTHGGFAPPPPHPQYQNTVTLDKQLETATDSIHHHMDGSVDRIIKVFNDTNNWTMDSIMRQVDNMADVARLLNSRAVGQTEVLRETQQLMVELRSKLQAIRHENRQMEERVLSTVRNEVQSMKAESAVNQAHTTAGTTPKKWAHLDVFDNNAEFSGGSTAVAGAGSPHGSPQGNRGERRTPRGRRGMFNKNRRTPRAGGRSEHRDGNGTAQDTERREAQRGSEIKAIPPATIPVRSLSVPPFNATTPQRPLVSHASLQTPLTVSHLPYRSGSGGWFPPGHPTWTGSGTGTGWFRVPWRATQESTGSLQPRTSQLAITRTEGKLDASSGNDKGPGSETVQTPTGARSKFKNRQRQLQDAEDTSNTQPESLAGPRHETDLETNQSVCESGTHSGNTESADTSGAWRPALSQGPGGCFRTSSVLSNSSSSTPRVPPLSAAVPSMKHLAGTDTQPQPQPQPVAPSPSHVHPALRNKQQRQEMRQREEDRQRAAKQQTQSAGERGDAPFLSHDCRTQPRSYSNSDISHYYPPWANRTSAGPSPPYHSGLEVANVESAYPYAHEMAPVRDHYHLSAMQMYAGAIPGSPWQPYGPVAAGLDWNNPNSCQEVQNDGKKEEKKKEEEEEEEEEAGSQAGKKQE